MSDEKLKPCPFCGGFDLAVETYSVQPDNYHSGYIQCGDCDCEGARPEGWLSNPEEARFSAIAAWNARSEGPAHLPALKAAGGWRAIESAPKDGTYVDLWNADGYRLTDCFWGLPDHTCGEAGQYCDSDWHGAQPGWVDGTFNHFISAEGVTRWIPLPPAPGSLALGAVPEGGEERGAG